MTSSNQNQMKYQGLIVLVLFLGLALNFNNCGRSPSIEGSDLSNRSLEARLRDVKTVNEGTLPIGFCGKTQNYGCLHKVFSTSVNDEEFASSQQCATESGFCVEVKSRTYNSAVLAQDCPTCENNYDEYECHVKLPDSSGLYPLVVTGKSFEEALIQVREFCFSVSGGR